MSDTPRTKLIMDNLACAILADTREQSIAHREEAQREIEQLERELAEANAHASRLQDRLAEVQAEKSDALIAAVEEIAAVTTERDALRADLCTFAVDMERQLSAKLAKEGK